MTTKQIPVGYTIAERDGSAVGKWISWMAYFMTLDEAKAKAEEHIKFLKTLGEDVVLVTLYATSEQ
jgi:hypothetical protein